MPRPTGVPGRVRPTGPVRVGLHIALGLVLVGIAGYGFIAIAGRVFGDPADAAVLSALTALYLLVNVLGPGAFAAVEQETSRGVSAARAAGLSAWPVARRAAVLTAGLFAVLAVLALALWPVLGRVLDGRPGLLAALLVAAAGFGVMYWVRGVLSGQGRLGRYAASLYLEGAARLVPCVVLFALAVRTPEAYGVAFAAGSCVAGALLVPGPGLRSGPPGADPSGMGVSLGMLVTAGLCMQLVANVGPVVVTYRSPDDLVAAGVFGLAFVLARVPLFLYSPVQALLVPALTRAVTAGDVPVARRLVGRALGAVLGVGAVGVVVAAIVGPVAVELLFNAAQRPGAGTLVVLGLATTAMMAALTLQSMLIALGGQRTVTLSWAAGTAVFVPLLFLPIPPIDAALVAQLAGPLTVVGLAAAGVHRALRGRGYPAG
ncbi:lipopolysaccharide biosynthesis protein [Pseudonocardia saturnea]